MFVAASPSTSQFLTNRPTTFDAALKGGQMVVPGSGLKPLQHLDHIRQVSGMDQALVHGKVLDSCVHTHLAGVEQTIRNVNLVRVGDGRMRDIVLFIKCQQRLDMALLGLYNVDEGAYGAKRIDKTWR
jgi:hypothetical protein